MSIPILTTKLFIPPPRPQVVVRSRLMERLNESLHRKLTLISAPAGFGKTTLMSEWIVGCKRLEPEVYAAWLSLDEGDSDSTRFLVYLIAALQTVSADIGNRMLAVLQSSQPPPSEAILTVLLNEIATIPNHIILVLDDYHLIECSAVDQALTFLIEHLPPQMHLVIATREDPGLPLARYRSRDQLTELRAADLRFTPAEAAEFLNEVMGLKLAAEDIAALEMRTEGWIAGLQLAFLALKGMRQGYQDAASLIRSFTGSHHFVLDYLLEEVLQHQSESIQAFLLRTSILDRLCGPLCDAIWRIPGASGQETLEYLERANLFIVPLDNERRWYRYHHLFADLLRQRLHQNPISLAEGESAGVSELHNRASVWFEENDDEAEAFHHALAAGDFERAADLAERTWQVMDMRFQSATWLGWVQALPDELVRARPILSVGFAWAFMDSGDVEASESRLRDAERWLEGSPDRRVAMNEAQLRTLPAKIALAHAYNAQAQGDVSGTAKYAELALKLTPEEDHLGRAQAAVTLGLTYWASGDLQTVQRAMTDWVNSMQKAGNIFFVIPSLNTLAEIMSAQGHLHEAARTYQQALQLASAHDESVLRVTANGHLGLGMLYHEMGNQEAAAQHLAKSRTLGEQTSLVDWPYRWCLAQARLKETEGDWDAALDLLDEATRLYVRTPVPDIRPIEAVKARVYVRQGRLTRSLAWVQARDLSVDDDLSYLREFEHITLARVLIAQNTNEQAAALLARLLETAEKGGRIGSMIEILVLQTLVHEAQGNTTLALSSLERALFLADPEGYVRIFVDEGSRMAGLLDKAAKQGVAPNYVRQLRAAFGKTGGETSAAQLLSEPLSERELEVLRLLGTELDGPAIADKLMVSLNTMRTHTKNIYNKLCVNNRRAAIRRAEELDLL